MPSVFFPETDDQVERPVSWEVTGWCTVFMDSRKAEQKQGCGNLTTDKGGFLLLENASERVKRQKQVGKEVEEKEKDYLFPFLKSTRYGRKPLGWPEAVARCHAGWPLVKSVSVKKLTATDVAGHHNRLLIPRDEAKDLLKELSEGERRMVCDEGGKGLLVPTLDEEGRPWALVFIYWSSNRAYVLKKDWFKLAYSNGFRAGNDVELLSFRQRTSRRLCFVVLHRSPAARTGQDQGELDGEEFAGCDQGEEDHVPRD